LISFKCFALVQLAFVFLISGSKSRTKIIEGEREGERDREETFAFKFKMSPLVTDVEI
jgi:hypothetical protein